MGDAFDLHEEVEALQDLSTYTIPNEHDIASLSGAQVTPLLESAYLSPELLRL
jgi:condensin complex subunit 1